MPNTKIQCFSINVKEEKTEGKTKKGSDKEKKIPMHGEDFLTSDFKGYSKQILAYVLGSRQCL